MFGVFWVLHRVTPFFKWRYVVTIDVWGGRLAASTIPNDFWPRRFGWIGREKSSRTACEVYALIAAMRLDSKSQ